MVKRYNLHCTAPDLKDGAVILASASGASETLAVPVEGRLNISKPGPLQPTELVRCIEALIGSVRMSRSCASALRKSYSPQQFAQKARGSQRKKQVGRIQNQADQDGY